MPSSKKQDINLLQQSKEVESGNDPAKAVSFYKQLIREQPLSAIAYDRLMIIYRKLKNYKDELRVITKGIIDFENYFAKRTQRLLKNKKLVKISHALMKSMGNKGQQPEYLPEPLGRWGKRRELVKAKLKIAS